MEAAHHHHDHDSRGLEWENLALYSSNKPINNGVLPMNDDMCQEGRDFGKLGYEDMMMMRMQCSSDHPTIGLRLGHHKEYEYKYEYGDAISSSRGLINNSSSSSSSSSILVSSSTTTTPTPTKRSRASYHNMQNPCCQVEGCNLDLKLAKDYHRRHRICESHSKSPKVVVAGMERRFCQQCSRFHDLSEFDDKKRSCRRRLSDHNARRRRVQPESIQLTSPAGISSALYTDQRQQNVLLNGLPVSMPNSSSWENACTIPRHALVRPPKTALNDDVLHIDPTSLHRSSTPRINLDQCLHVGSSNSAMAPELLSAHSLLSSNSWSLHEGESTSMEGINYSPVMRHSEPDSHNNLPLFHSSSNNNNSSSSIGLDHHHHQGAPAAASSFLHSVNMQINAAASHQQEYQLFKPPNYLSGNFYSSHRS